MAAGGDRGCLHGTALDPTESEWVFSWYRLLAMPFVGVAAEDRNQADRRLRRRSAEKEIPLRGTFCVYQRGLNEC